MKAEKIVYSSGSQSFQGTLVYEEVIKDRRPLPLMSPNWLGPTERAIKRAQTMVGDKDIGFVVDMYGRRSLRERTAGRRATRRRAAQ